MSGYKLGVDQVNVVWDDMKFPATRQRQGATQKPDFDYTNMGLLFPQNDATEISYLIGQFSHAYKEGSDISPHLHFIQDSASTPTFKMDYRWYNNEDDISALGWTTLTASTFAFTWTSGDLVQIASFPDISGTGKKISSMIEIKLYRDDNVVTGDVLLKEFDVHYQIDSNGSRQEFIK